MSGYPDWISRLEAATDTAVARIMRGDPPPCEHRYCHIQGCAMCFGITAAQYELDDR